MRSKHHKNHAFVLSTLIIGILVLAVLVVFLSSKNALPPLSQLLNTNATSTIRIAAPLGVINVEVADTDALRERGLSGRMTLGADRGMLFVFGRPGIYGFWMKDMNFPLDMVWIDAGHKVVSINSDIATSTYPDSIFPPSNISYVLELNAGAAKRSGMMVGTVLIFRDN